MTNFNWLKIATINKDLLVLFLWTVLWCWDFEFRICCQGDHSVMELTFYFRWTFSSENRPTEIQGRVYMLSNIPTNSARMKIVVVNWNWWMVHIHDMLPIETISMVFHTVTEKNICWHRKILFLLISWLNR